MNCLKFIYLVIGVVSDVMEFGHQIRILLKFLWYSYRGCIKYLIFNSWLNLKVVFINKHLVKLFDFFENIIAISVMLKPYLARSVIVHKIFEIFQIS